MDNLKPARGPGLTFRWLGAAGLAFEMGGTILLVDPFFTRPPARALLFFARVGSDPDLAAHFAPKADYVLVTHAHYDHLMDVPEVLRQTGARAYGSANTRDLLALHGLPDAQLATVRPGDRLGLGPFTVEVFPAQHTHTPFGRIIDGQLPEHLTRGRPQLPLRLTDYRMDSCFSFRILAGGHSMLVGNHPTPAEQLFLYPYDSGERLRQLLEAITPDRVVPIHWDDFTRPLTQPLKPMLVTRRQGLTGWRPVGRVDLRAFTHRVNEILPAAQVLVPDLFRIYDIK